MKKYSPPFVQSFGEISRSFFPALVGAAAAAVKGLSAGKLLIAGAAVGLAAGSSKKGRFDGRVYLPIVASQSEAFSEG